MPMKQATRELAVLRRRGTITTILVMMIIVMIVRDVLARRPTSPAACPEPAPGVKPATRLRIRRAS